MSERPAYDGALHAVLKHSCCRMVAEQMGALALSFVLPDPRQAVCLVCDGPYVLCRNMALTGIFHAKEISRRRCRKSP